MADFIIMSLGSYYLAPERENRLVQGFLFVIIFIPDIFIMVTDMSAKAIVGLPRKYLKGLTQLKGLFFCLSSPITTTFFFSFSQNVDVMDGAPAAFLDHETSKKDVCRMFKKDF